MLQPTANDVSIIHQILQIFDRVQIYQYFKSNLFISQNYQNIQEEILLSYSATHTEMKKYLLKMPTPDFSLIFPCFIRPLIYNIYAFKTLGHLDIESQIFHSENENIEEEKICIKNA